MPNWCHNYLWVHSEDHPSLEAFQKAAVPQGPREGLAPLSFASIVPEPEYDQDDGWYLWRLEHWGTKWEPSFGNYPVAALGSPEANVARTLDGQRLTEQVGRIEYRFDTAWSPPVPWTVRASKAWPTLLFTLRFAEVGSQSAGELEIRAGQIIKEQELTLEDVLEEHEMWY